MTHLGCNESVLPIEAPATLKRVNKHSSLASPSIVRTRTHTHGHLLWVIRPSMIDWPYWKVDSLCTLMTQPYMDEGFSPSRLSFSRRLRSTLIDRQVIYYLESWFIDIGCYWASSRTCGLVLKLVIYANTVRPHWSAADVKTRYGEASLQPMEIASSQGISRVTSHYLQITALAVVSSFSEMIGPVAQTTSVDELKTISEVFCRTCNKYYAPRCVNLSIKSTSYAIQSQFQWKLSAINSTPTWQP